MREARFQRHSVRARPAANGFTRLEAVLVIATTALVGALGLLAWRVYLVRAEIAESIALAKLTQHQITRTFRRSGTPPADRADLPDPGIDNASRYVAETRIIDGRIDLVFSAAADAVLEGRTISLTPFETADQQVVWICGSRQPGIGLQPLGFASGGRAAVQAPTTIEPRYLPPACR